MNNSNDKRDLIVHITSGTFIKAILVILLFALLYILKDLVLVILTAIVIASSVEPATKWFVKYKVPRVAAVILIYLGIIGGLAGVLFVFAPPLIDDTLNFLSIAPQYIDSIDLWSPVKERGILSPSTVEQLSPNVSMKEALYEFRSGLGNAAEGFWQITNSIFGGAFNFILILIISFYLAVQERGIASFLRTITPFKHEKYVLDLWRRSQLKIGLWMQGQLLLALIIGVLVYLGLTILGVKYAFLLALMSAVAELIPLFGPIIAAIPAIALAFVDGGTTLGLVVLGFYVIIQQFENHLIYPLVVKKVVGVPPLLVIIALIIGAQLAGFLGLILS
ncbi:AI-2E family transporter, partial [Patescibacteria group bacterium]